MLLITGLSEMRNRIGSLYRRFVMQSTGTKEWLLRQWFGVDVFISYGRVDAFNYAAALASALAEKGLWCHFDQWQAHPGVAGDQTEDLSSEELDKRAGEPVADDRNAPPQLPRHLHLALKRSSLLVVIGTRRSGQSAFVKREILDFLPTKRFIVPIDVDSTIEQATWWPLLRGLALSPDHPELIIEHGSTDEPPRSPSDEVVERILNSVNFTTRTQKIRSYAIGGLTVLACALVIAAFVGWKASSLQELADSYANSPCLKSKIIFT